MGQQPRLGVDAMQRQALADMAWYVNNVAQTKLQGQRQQLEARLAAFLTEAQQAVAEAQRAGEAYIRNLLDQVAKDLAPGTQAVLEDATKILDAAYRCLHCRVLELYRTYVLKRVLSGRTDKKGKLPGPLVWTTDTWERKVGQEYESRRAAEAAAADSPKGAKSTRPEWAVQLQDLWQARSPDAWVAASAGVLQVVLREHLVRLAWFKMLDKPPSTDAAGRTRWNTEMREGMHRVAQCQKTAVEQSTQSAEPALPFGPLVALPKEE